MIYLFYFYDNSGDPVKMAMVNIESRLPPRQRFEQLSHGLTALLPYLSVRNACINLAFLCLIGYFLFFCLKFPSYSFITIFLFSFSCGAFCCHVWESFFLEELMEVSVMIC
jgi:hypothetical protein